MNIVNRRDDSFLVYHYGVYLIVSVTLENGKHVIKKQRIYLDNDTHKQLTNLILNNVEKHDNDETTRKGIQ